MLTWRSICRLTASQRGRCKCPRRAQWINQMSGNQVQQNANIGGSVFHAPPPQMHTNFEVNQNVNPSTITFQNEGNKSHHNYVNGNSQLRSNLNLQQIDEQLQMSRKLFPSWSSKNNIHNLYSSNTYSTIHHHHHHHLIIIINKIMNMAFESGDPFERFNTEKDVTFSELFEFDRIEP